jgi:ADP-ribose pyrophosphatase YjhB (NUDIX family)
MIMWSSMLCFLQKDGQILLGMKKRDFGKGKWNGIGGKVEGDKSMRAAAVRELKEEISVVCEESALLQVATLEFRSENKDLEWDVDVFFVNTWSGEPKESDEMIPQWFKESELPFDQMWPDDRHWFPPLLAGSTILGKFTLNKEGKEIESFTITETAFTKA